MKQFRAESETRAGRSIIRCYWVSWAKKGSIERGRNCGDSGMWPDSGYHFEMRAYEISWWIRSRTPNGRIWNDWALEAAQLITSVWGRKGRSGRKKYIWPMMAAGTVRWQKTEAPVSFSACSLTPKAFFLCPLTSPTFCRPGHPRLKGHQAYIVSVFLSFSFMVALSLPFFFSLETHLEPWSCGTDEQKCCSGDQRCGSHSLSVSNSIDRMG